MDFKEAFKTFRSSTMEFVSHLPVVRETCKRAFCSSIRFVSTWRVRESFKRLSYHGKEMCARLYDRYIIRGEYTSRDLAILFIFAILVGASIKVAASDTLTIGFQDYTLAPAGTSIDLNAVQKEVLRGGGSLTLSGNVPDGKTCSQ